MQALVEKYIKENMAQFRKVFKELCLIPAPSHKEEKRAEYVKKWFHDNKMDEAYIDEAQNVIYPINAKDSSELTVFVAHTDTVFPDTEPMPYKEEDGKIFCPGCGDDTASLVVLMFAAKFFQENSLKPEKGVLFVANSCEEGLGNLKGTRQIFKDFEGRIKQFVSYDSASLSHVASECVGSHRYEVTVKTEGGHSYGRFGNKNAIAELSKIITKIYEIEVPCVEGSKTTYNVGGISGGTSVNTIAQEAKMLCEYRSTHAECLAVMKAKFEEIFESAKSEKTEVLVELIGERPCSEIPEEIQNAFAQKCGKIIENINGKEVSYGSSSTDCNIPMSLGIPGIAMGVYVGGGAHTREEWVDISSLEKGLEQGIKFPMVLMEVE